VKEGKQADPGAGAGAGAESGKNMADGKPPGAAGQEGGEPGKGAAGEPKGKGGQATAADGKEGSGKSPSPQGDGKTPSGTPGSSPGGEMAGNSSSSPEGKGSSPGSPPGRGGQPSPGATGKGAVAQGGNAGGADNHGGLGDNKGLSFEQVAEVANENPVTGENYGAWTDRLRKVEEALNAPELRNQASRVLDNAREMRADFRRNNQAPQTAQLQTMITEPLAELRNRVAEELAKREATNPLAPLDRDPVPQRYREMVRRYYQELGAGD
jgi:hypothetical protein